MCYEVKLFEKLERNKYNPLKYISPYYHYHLYTANYKKESWLGSYKQMATKSIRDYEDWLDKDDEEKMKQKCGIEEWKSWDGKVV
jgi:hypothetical protein